MLDKFKFTKLLQSQKARLPILVTLSGIVTLTKLLQFSNALLPIFITPFEITTLDKFFEFSNALSQIPTTGLPHIFSGITTSVSVPTYSTIQHLLEVLFTIQSFPLSP